MNRDDDCYEVGYGKPPTSGQFLKGQSGNAKGRPKGSKNLATIVLRVSRQLVRVSGPGGTRIVTKLEAAAMQMGNKAAQGDLAAQREFFHLIRLSEESVSSDRTHSVIEDADRQTMQSVLRRMKQIGGDESGNSEVQED